MKIENYSVYVKRGERIPQATVRDRSALREKQCRIKNAECRNEKQNLNLPKSYVLCHIGESFG